MFRGYGDKAFNMINASQDGQRKNEKYTTTHGCKKEHGSRELLIVLSDSVIVTGNA